MSNIVHFGIDTDDIQRAKTFYEKVFGWEIREIRKNNQYLIFPENDGGIKIDNSFNTLRNSIGIGVLQQRANQERNTVMIQVSNIEKTRKLIEQNGGKLFTPKIPIPGVGLLSVFQDTEGNVFSIIEENSLTDLLLWSDFTDEIEYQETLLEKLGYPKGSIFAIVHADDIGMHPKHSDGALDAMKYGMCKTGSVMVPCPDAKRVLKIWKENPDLDLGIHLTLNSEWGKSYGWTPLLSKAEVPSLYNPEGYMWQFEHELRQNLNVEEAIKELEAQILTVLEAGLNPTHLDDHMGCYFVHPDLGKGIELLSKKYKLPMIPYYRDTARSRGYVYPNTFWQFSTVIGETWNPNLRKEKYHNWLRDLKPGVHEVVTHISFPSEELEEILEPAGTAQYYVRVGDYDVWTSSETKNLAEKLGITFIGYKELHKLQVKMWEMDQ